MKIRENRKFIKYISTVIAIICIIEIFNLGRVSLKNKEIETVATQKVDIDNAKNETKLALSEDNAEISLKQYKNEDIKEVKTLISKLINQLKQITLQRNKENLEAYDEYVNLLNNIEENKATYLLLKIKSQSNSLEAILDEYLLTIQINIDLEKCLTNKEDYEREREESIKKLNKTEIITLAKIEEVYLGELQETDSIKDNKGIIENNKEKNTENQNNLDFNNITNEKEVKNDNPKTKQPTEKAMNEINNIQSKSIDVEGR